MNDRPTLEVIREFAAFIKSNSGLKDCPRYSDGHADCTTCEFSYDDGYMSHHCIQLALADESSKFLRSHS